MLGVRPRELTNFIELILTMLDAFGGEVVTEDVLEVIASDITFRCGDGEVEIMKPAEDSLDVG